MLISIRNHLIFFFKSGGSLLQDILTLKASHKRKKDPGICDVLDGRLYKEYFNSDGFIRGSSPQKNEVHISFQVNTDGVSLFRSSKFAVWPVYLIINEIPPNYRWTIVSNFSLYNRDVSKKINCQSVEAFKLLKLESALFYCVCDAKIQVMFTSSSSVSKICWHLTISDIPDTNTCTCISACSCKKWKQCTINNRCQHQFGILVFVMRYKGTSMHNFVAYIAWKKLCMHNFLKLMIKAQYSIVF